MDMRKTRFGIDCLEEVFVGYTNGELWNGWACPRFTKEVADKIVELHNHSDGCKATYDEETDTYYFYFDGDDEPYEHKGFDADTVDGVKHLYDIGAWCWIWDEIEEEKEQELETEFVYLTLDPEELMALGFIEQPDKEQITNAIHGLIDRQRTNRVCCRCGNPIYVSDVEGYPYVCYHCDENMFTFETEEVE